MIVNPTDEGWDIVFQPAHGLLAAKLASEFAEDRRCPFWLETVTAIATHDDGQVAFQPGDRRYLTQAGAPKDFTAVELSAEQRYEKTRDCLENAYRKHRWTGLLESQHAEFLYGEKDAASDSLKELLANERQHREHVLDELELDRDDLQIAYDIMRWCDRCSLILCQDRIPSIGRNLEVITFANGTRVDLSQDDSGNLRINPWLFGTAKFEATVEVHRLTRLAFEDDEQLEQALRDCTTHVRRYEFERSVEMP
ncbi:hypothetical protein Mal64_06730 [Pseudobythopirellula maris]|uniref:DUF3891 domain-containing protein n=1 Tax=Pseudobythopirellula maris TaxID=2527991 RepID=A0A5C5ZTE4_9BACT|nr:DUF3891 family protein [Pseudobythopirellula maris]TWT90288.1 hypothetical protein Mal64_06730 [Pseudobythopirellula maris]